MHGANQTIIGLLDCELKLNAASGYIHRITTDELSPEIKEEIKRLLDEIEHITESTNKLRLKMLTKCIH